MPLLSRIILSYRSRKRKLRQELKAQKKMLSRQEKRLKRPPKSKLQSNILKTRPKKWTYLRWLNIVKW